MNNCNRLVMWCIICCCYSTIVLTVIFKPFSVFNDDTFIFKPFSVFNDDTYGKIPYDYFVASLKDFLNMDKITAIENSAPEYTDVLFGSLPFEERLKFLHDKAIFDTNRDYDEKPPKYYPPSPYYIPHMIPHMKEMLSEEISEMAFGLNMESIVWNLAEGTTGEKIPYIGNRLIGVNHDRMRWIAKVLYSEEFAIKFDDFWKDRPPSPEKEIQSQTFDEAMDSLTSMGILQVVDDEKKIRLAGNVDISSFKTEYVNVNGVIYFDTTVGKKNK